MRILTTLLISGGLIIGCRMPQGASAPALAGEWTIKLGSTLSADDFEVIGGTWTVESGVIRSLGEQNNHPLWLKRSIPDAFEISFEARANSAAVDHKIEFCGDGVRHESGYIAILGGWGNTVSVIARQDEHEKSRKEVKGKWQRNHWYKHRLRRSFDGKRGRIEWFVDGKLLLERVDPKPLRGPGHNRIAFNNWKTDMSLRNIVVRPL
ncbi:MAG: hypothetical protein OSB21_10925 [Myxococcota bacterium]|nr:hypothetical protein [Myxococcota bacterium]